jgi:hypothetical protein
MPIDSPSSWHRPLSPTVRPTSERIEDGDPRGLEVRYVARHYGEPVFQRRGRDHEIGAVVAESGAQGTSTTRRRQIEWHNPIAVEGQHPVEPFRKRTGEVWISRALSRNPALNFANADDAEEKIGRSLPFEPRHDHRIALPPAQLGQRDGIDQEYQRSRSRIRTLPRGEFAVILWHGEQHVGRRAFARGARPAPPIPRAGCSIERCRGSPRSTATCSSDLPAHPASFSVGQFVVSAVAQNIQSNLGIGIGMCEVEVAVR